VPKITRRNFSKALAKGLGAAALIKSGALSLSHGGNMKKKPNFVFICSDQHSHKYAGYMKHPHVKTPNLDRIAGSGVAFTSCYTGNPVCVPGRTSMMTGMYASDCNSFCNSTVWDGSHPLWAKILSDGGYHCRATGKLDLNDRFDTGFEEDQTHHGHAHRPDITSLFRRPVAYRMDERGQVEGRARSNPHNDKKAADRAVDFIQKRAPKLKKPWALYAGFTEPHPHFVALKKYYDMYYPKNVDMPDVPPGHLEDLHLVYQELRHFKRIATPIPDERIRRARAGYYGMITELDEYVGQIWKALEKTGQLDNTIFIYTSDHGDSLGEHGLWFKNNLYDDAARVPLVMAGPGLPKNKSIESPMGHVDLIATMVEWAGVKKPSALRGKSLKGLIKGDESRGPDFAFSETHSEGNCTGSFMIRKGPWKYIHFTWYDDLLFNLEKDPGEFSNLADKPDARKIKSELKSILNGLVNTEEVTLKAFKAQEKFLQDMAGKMSEDELFKVLKSRLGQGQARAMAAKLKRS
jgi:choline-sulfatase